MDDEKYIIDVIEYNKMNFQIIIIPPFEETITKIGQFQYIESVNILSIGYDVDMQFYLISNELINSI